MPKKVLIALPQAMLEQIDYVATAEHRTRSDLIRESLRRYLGNFREDRALHVVPGVPHNRVQDIKRTGVIAIGHEEDQTKMGTHTP